MFIAKDTWDIVGNPYFTSNVDAILDTFNIYFDVNSTRTNFIFTVVDPGKYADIVSADYSYIIITKPEWEKMSQLQQVVSVVNQNYQMFFEPKGILVLLKARWQYGGLWGSFYHFYDFNIQAGRFDCFTAGNVRTLYAVFFMQGILVWSIFFPNLKEDHRYADRQGGINRILWLRKSSITPNW